MKSSQTDDWWEPLGRLAGYLALAVLVEMLLLRVAVATLTVLVLPPLVAEVALLGCRAWARPYWRGLLARIGALLLAGLLQMLLAFTPMAYDHRNPPSSAEGDDGLELLLSDGAMLVTQPIVAALLLGCIRRRSQEEESSSQDHPPEAPPPDPD